MLGDVEGVEVVVRSIDLGSVDQLESEPSQDVQAAVFDLGEGMTRATARGLARHTQVRPLRVQLRRKSLGSDALCGLIQGAGDGLIGRV